MEVEFACCWDFILKCIIIKLVSNYIMMTEAIDQGRSTGGPWATSGPPEVSIWPPISTASGSIRQSIVITR